MGVASQSQLKVVLPASSNGPVALVATIPAVRQEDNDFAVPLEIALANTNGRWNPLALELDPPPKTILEVVVNEPLLLPTAQNFVTGWDNNYRLGTLPLLRYLTRTHFQSGLRYYLPAALTATGAEAGFWVSGLILTASYMEKLAPNSRVLFYL